MDSNKNKKIFEIHRDLSDGSYLITKTSSTNYIRLKSVISEKSLLENFTVCALDSECFPCRDVQFICRTNANLGVLAMPNKLSSSTLNTSTSNAFYIVGVIQNTHVGTLRQNIAVFRINDVKFIPLATTVNINEKQHEEESHADVKRFLTSGCFYYACKLDRNGHIDQFHDFTLNSNGFYMKSPPQRNFYWNRGWVLPILRVGIKQRDWLAPVICGSVTCQTTNISHNCLLSLWLISRMSCKNVGTRFNTRGVNDGGYTANFVETEQILIKKTTDQSGMTTCDECSFLLIRGSIPLHWTQSSLQVGSHRISMSRNITLSYPSFISHFKRLCLHYGDIFVLSLASSKQDEGSLTRNYLSTFTQMNSEYPNGFCDEKSNQPFQFTHFDYHEHMKSVKNISVESFVINYLLKHHEGQAVWPFISSRGIWHFRTIIDSNHNRISKTCLSRQTGVVRYNCIDCLDRTNAVQSWIAYAVLYSIQTPKLGATNLNSIVQTALRNAQISGWIENGNSISKIYTGTGALTGKSRAHDVGRSLARALQNNLYDDTKTAAMEVLVQSYNRFRSVENLISTHLSPQLKFGDESVLRYLARCNAPNRPTLINGISSVDGSIAQRRTIRVGIYTWNINGDKDQATETNRDDETGETATLSSWLLEGAEQLIQQNANKSLPKRVNGFVSDHYSSAEPDIYAIGFQEICDITASSIVKASEENMERWYEMISSLLNKNSSEDRYVVVSRDQLVGVCLILFAKRSLVPHIRFIKTAKIKTGFMNSAGNKGCVAVRFALFNTTLCFICAHFEAGQNQVAERNDNYCSIISKLSNRFKSHVLVHDYVLFFGDFNYRVNLNRAQVLECIRLKKYTELLSADQLIEEKLMKKVFDGFQEGPVMFDPTYKYDYHCQEYDTSEKARIPSWCDRIMWKQNYPLCFLSEQRSTDLSNGAELLYYGRAELMTSDHRPVTALLNIDTIKIDENDLVETYKRLRSHSFISRIVKSKNGLPTIIQSNERLQKLRAEHGNELLDSFFTSDARLAYTYLIFKDPEKAHMLSQFSDNPENLFNLERVSADDLQTEFELMFETSSMRRKKNTSRANHVICPGNNNRFASIGYSVDEGGDKTIHGSAHELGNIQISSSASNLITFDQPLPITSHTNCTSSNKCDEESSTTVPLPSSWDSKSSVLDELLSIDWAASTKKES